MVEITPELLTVDVGKGSIIALLQIPPSANDWVVVYAPGAGSNINDPFGVRLSEAMVSHGHTTIRFGFPYMEAGRRGPDRPEVLENTWRAVITLARSYGGKIVIGGRSMGGRIASHVVAQGVWVDALVLFAYPLRSPAGKVRDGHLSGIKVPTLFISGTRDSFGTSDEFRNVVANVPGAELHLLDEADHGFNVPQSSGKTRDDVWEEAVEKSVRWLERFQRPSGVR